MIRCWICGVEPDLAEVSTLGEAHRRYVAAGWPPGDHEHAERPPTPDELVERGHQILQRLLTDW